MLRVPCWISPTVSTLGYRCREIGRVKGIPAELGTGGLSAERGALHLRQVTTFRPAQQIFA